jgi:3,4-dihydroxy 2-butanone 4-phosphate synthase/GTP cyclohydrolase II
MQHIAKEDRGVVILFRDIEAALPSTEEAQPRTLRHTGLGSQIMSTLGLHKITLLTDTPLPKFIGLDAYGLEIVGTHPISKD